jgi:hypothetical protein
MSTQDDNKLIFTDSGIMVRVFGAFALIGSLGFFQAKMPGAGALVFSLAGWIFVVGGLAMLLLASDLTVTADRSKHMLRLEYRYLWLFRLSREIPFDEIADFRTVSSSHTRRGHTSTAYRLEAVLTDGKTVRFRWYSTGDESTKKQQAARLRTAVGLVRKRKASPDSAPTEVAAEANELSAFEQAGSGEDAMAK